MSCAGAEEIAPPSLDAGLDLEEFRDMAVVPPQVDLEAQLDADAEAARAARPVRRRLFDSDEDLFHDMPVVGKPSPPLSEAFFAALDADADAWRASRAARPALEGRPDEALFAALNEALEGEPDEALFAALNADADAAMRGVTGEAYVDRGARFPPPTFEDEAQQAERLQRINERADAAKKAYRDSKELK
jgi:hypothetical protein